MLMALWLFFEKRYRQAIFPSTRMGVRTLLLFEQLVDGLELVEGGVQVEMELRDDA